MINITRTTSDNPEFIRLVAHLDQDLAIRDGDDHAFYSQFNKIDKIRHCVVAFIDQIAVGCGAIREYEPGMVEVKRMYVLPEYRGRGIASAVLEAVEHWATELGYARCILETGIKQPEAIGLYLKSGYRIMPNYGQYAGVDNSVCMEKWVQPGASLRAQGYAISNDRPKMDLSVIHRYLSEASYWCPGIPIETVQKSIDNSLCFGIFHHDQQVGFARVITDYATFGYLADVFVLPEHRGKGLSKWLMQTIIAHPQLQGFRRLLLATADAHGLYSQFGWKPLARPERWMEVHRPDVYKGVSPKPS
jgi:GNAT superfamily N-acetyltransferase